MYDLFISHASEDKDAFVRPLANALRSAGLTVWYDEFTLRLGDSLRYSIDRGLAQSRFGVVVLSPSFFAKEWPQAELNGLFAREMAGGKAILPIWHRMRHSDVLRHAPMLADKVAVSSERGIDDVVQQILDVVREPTSSTSAEHGISTYAQPNVFTKERFRVASQNSIETRFSIDSRTAGREARARPGAVTKGNALVVVFQDYEVNDSGMVVWLTIENIGQTGMRWFGAHLLAFVHGDYRDIQPDLALKVAVDWSTCSRVSKLQSVIGSLA